MKSSKTELISFLESFPLYRKKDFSQPKAPSDLTVAARRAFVSSQLPPPKGFSLPQIIRIEMPCLQTCGDRRTFERRLSQDELVGRSLSGAPVSDVMEPRHAYRLAFTCTHCGEHRIFFLIHVDRIDTDTIEGFSLTKAGQWPSARPKVDRALERALGEAVAPLYEKGLTLEDHDFGIGAFAYYRRVAENMIDKLLADLRAYAETTGAADLVKALDNVTHGTQASMRIAAVKELLPKTLRPDGLNPLGTIYQALSDGLHGRDDEHCLTLAADLRTALDFLITTMASEKATAEKYVAAVRGLQKAAAKKTKAGDQ